MRNHSSKIFIVSKTITTQKPSAGFTLIELLVAVLISMIVIGIAGSGIVTILTINKKAESRTERRIDLSRGFDFITNEIRMARRINRSATTVANGTTVTIDDVVTSGLSLSALGSYGTIVLYLEIPITAAIPAICPAGGPNPGAAPPAPAEHDRVVYDIRSDINGWLGPRVINRYGRIPRSDGTIDPCSNPVASDTLADSISDTNISPTPTCNSPAVLSGAGGFYACVNGRQVDIYLRSRVTDTEAHSLTSRAVSRLRSSSTAPAPPILLPGTRTSGTNTMNLSWTWTGGSATFKLYKSVGGGVTAEVYSGSDLSRANILTGNAGDSNCYTVTATVDSNTSPYSNEVCEPK